MTDHPQRINAEKKMVEKTPRQESCWRLKGATPGWNILFSLFWASGGVKVTLNTEKRPFLHHRRETKETKAEWNQSSEVGVEPFRIGYHRGWL